ncbi:MAG: FAD-dependent oxidoreductase [Candidatus Electrothrix sp. YB6]
MEATVRFIERISRTPAANSYRFTRPPGFSFQAGQYAIVSLGEEGMLVHPLSFSDGPQKDYLEFTKRMTGSVYCQYLEGLYPGDRITVKGPIGSFSMRDIVNDIVYIVGGIGITPIRSMLAEAVHQRDRRRITLLYGNLNDDDIAFSRELAELPLPGFRLVHVLQHSWGKVEARQGFITSRIIEEEVTADIQSSTFLVSGPPAMVKAMEEQLFLLGVLENQIRLDRFLGYS